MKLICVNTPGNYKDYLTIGKIYEGEENEMFYHSISNDRGGNKDQYLKQICELEHLSPWVVFIKLDNWRERQINNILIENNK